MTRIHIRIAQFEGSVGLDAILIVVGVLCAGMLLTSFVDALKTSVQRGEALRETQRAGITAPHTNTARISNALLPVRQVAAVGAE